jgi:hypothetical protein
MRVQVRGGQHMHARSAPGLLCWSQAHGHKQALNPPHHDLVLDHVCMHALLGQDCHPLWYLVQAFPHTKVPAPTLIYAACILVHRSLCLARAPTCGCMHASLAPRTPWPQHFKKVLVNVSHFPPCTTCDTAQGRPGRGRDRGNAPTIGDGMGSRSARRARRCRGAACGR